MVLTIDFKAPKISFIVTCYNKESFIIPFNKEIRLKVIIDCGIMEFFCNDGAIYAAVEAEEDVLRKILTVESR